MSDSEYYASGEYGVYKDINTDDTPDYEPRFPSDGPEFDPMIKDWRGGVTMPSRASMYAAFDNGARRDMDTGVVWHRFPDR